MSYEAKVVVDEPIVTPLAHMQLIEPGLHEMISWCQSRAPRCVPEEYHLTQSPYVLFPHEGYRVDAPEGAPGELLTGNELLVELAGRKCYNSFGHKAGRKSNREYIEHTQSGDVPHASIMYHAKMSFFIAGVSRRVSHELIRHYVGADRDEEGSPSQESTRYVENAGFYIAHPAIRDNPIELGLFRTDMTRNYVSYRDYIDRRVTVYARENGSEPTGMDRKRIFESASPLLSHAVETSFIWTTNPSALAKMFRERDHEAADLEYLRFARKWKQLCLETWPNLFPQPWMRSGA